MLKEYRTILEPGEDEIIEKKSRFIGYVRHVETEEEANAFIMEIKKKHYDARHNCYAYVLGQEQPVLRFSDDGEPGGTAGKPILEVITGAGLSDVCIVVTRYFGGTLLGTGGLVRAYTDASKACIQATEIIRKQQVFPVVIKTNYNDLGKLQYLLSSEHIMITDSVYGENVELKVNIPYDDYDRIEKLLIEATAARADIEKQDVTYAAYTDHGLYEGGKE
ncbi:MAG: YigZ family protein [Lachnospiraceae bacterium]